MYVVGPPGADLGAGQPAPRLAAVHRRVLPGTGQYTSQDRTYFRDLMGSYGLACRDDEFDTGRVTYREMVAALLPELDGRAAGFDLAVLAHATPDAEPGWPMSVLVDAVPGAGLVFALSDQDTVSPFTALRLILDGIYRGPTGRSLLWVMDQTALLHDQPVPERLAARRNAAIALVLSPDGTLGSISAESRTCPDDRTVRAALDARLRELGGPVTVIGTPAVVPYLTGHPLVGEVHTVPPGLPCTGLWCAFADALPGWQRDGRRVLLADRAEEFGYLGLCAVHIDAAATRPPEPVGARQ